MKALQVERLALYANLRLQRQLHLTFLSQLKELLYLIAAVVGDIQMSGAIVIQDDKLEAHKELAVLMVLTHRIVGYHYRCALQLVEFNLVACLFFRLPCWS